MADNKNNHKKVECDYAHAVSKNKKIPLENTQFVAPTNTSPSSTTFPSNKTSVVGAGAWATKKSLPTTNTPSGSTTPTTISTISAGAWATKKSLPTTNTTSGGTSPATTSAGAWAKKLTGGKPSSWASTLATTTSGGAAPPVASEPTFTYRSRSEVLAAAAAIEVDELTGMKMPILLPTLDPKVVEIAWPVDRIRPTFAQEERFQHLLREDAFAPKSEEAYERAGLLAEESGFDIRTAHNFYNQLVLCYGFESKEAEEEAAANRIEAGTAMEAVFEEAFLSGTGIAYLTENQQKEKAEKDGVTLPSTPDFIITDARRIRVNGHPVKWIELKNTYISATKFSKSHPISKAHRQYARYSKAFGGGLAICKNSFSADYNPPDDTLMVDANFVQILMEKKEREASAAAAAAAAAEAEAEANAIANAVAIAAAAAATEEGVRAETGASSSAELESTSSLEGEKSSNTTSIIITAAAAPTDSTSVSGDVPSFPCSSSSGANNNEIAVHAVAALST